jgi:P4 family phage/plasmid primase-like protien
MTVLSQLFTSLDDVPGVEDTVGWALAYARAGISVFPAHGVRQTSWVAENGEVVSGLACTCAKGVMCTNAGKHPVGGLVPRGHLDAVRNHMTLRSWFKVGNQWNIGLATGNGLVVVDVDTKPDHEGQTGLDTLDTWENWVNGWSLPLGLRQATGSDGLHIWLRVAAGAQIPGGNRVLPGIDIKGDGGYVVVAPSMHLKGKRYGLAPGVADGWLSEIPELAGHPLTVLMGMKGGRYRTIKVAGLGGPGSGTGGGTGGAGYSFAEQLANGCGLGNRDVFFNDLAFRLRKKDVPIDDAAQTMRAAWVKAEKGEGDEFPWEHVVYKLKRVYDEVSVAHTDDLPAWRPPKTVAAVREFTVENAAVEDSLIMDLSVGGGPVVTGEALLASQVMGTRPELTMHYTDLGNAERFAKRMREAVRFAGDIRTWYTWNGESWMPDRHGIPMRLTKEIIKDLYEEALTCTCERNDAGECAHTRHAFKSESLASRRAMLSGAESEPEMEADADTWDSDPWLFVVPGGTIDLRTGQLRESLSGDYNTKRAGVQWLADADCPKWLEFLDFFTAGDGGMKSYLQRLAGYALTGLITEQKFMFLEGTGANGKNVFMETLLGIMGDYGKVGNTQLITGGDEQHPTILAALQGVRMVFVDEAKANRQLNVERIKSLTAPAIEARKMKQDFVVFRNQVKLFIAGNNHPTIKDSSDGTWRRLQRIMCNGKISEQAKVKNLVEILLRDEGPGILRWAVEGCLAWQQLGDLGAPLAVVTAVQEYRDEEDFIARFLEDRYQITHDVGDFVSAGAIYQEFQIWAALNGLAKNDVVNSIKFGRELGGEKHKLGTDVIRVEGKKTRVRTGIKVRES